MRSDSGDSFDASWRLWDVAAQKEILLQEGHSKGVYAIAFQLDGALVATAYVTVVTVSVTFARGGDCGVRVWDLRSGRNIALFEGHVKQVLTLDWSPNGCAGWDRLC